jgi:maleylacetate reductase
MNPFLFDIARYRVVFGRGKRSLAADEINALGCKRALLIPSPSHVEAAGRLHAQLGALSVGVYDKEVVQHVPAEVAAAGVAEVNRLGADCCLAIGGGSAIGLAKAIALQTSLPILAMPTTYAGSEMTPIWGISADGEKRTGRDLRVLPRSVIYDSELVAGFPAKIAGPSGMNAMAHCVEGLYAQNANPMISTLAQEGVRALAQALPMVCRDPNDLDGHDQALLGACLAGLVLGSVGMSLHHKLCHTLGGSFNTPHAETHAIMIPYVTAYNIGAAPDAKARLAAALGTTEVAAALQRLATQVGAPRTLQELGLKYEDLDRAADIATRTPYFNPRPVTRDSIRRLLEDAWQGVLPA